MSTINSFPVLLAAFLRLSLTFKKSNIVVKNFSRAVAVLISSLALQAYALQLVSVSPQNEVARVRQVVAKFNESAVNFGDAKAPAPLVLTCSDAQASKGNGRWISDREWSFEFENQPYFYGFRDLATNGIDKPVLNVFRMFGMMSGKRVEVKGNQNYNFTMIRDSSVRGKNADIDALASKDTRSASVMLWHYHDDDVMTANANIEVELKGLQAKVVNFHHYRIDNENSNSYEVWKKMGSPENPTKEQIVLLEKAGQLTLLTSPSYLKTNNGELKLNVSLPRQGVSLLKFDW